MKTFKLKNVLVTALVFALCTLQVNPTFAEKSKNVNLTIASNQKTFQLHVGDTLNLKLDSTYWTLDPINGNKIQQLTDPVITPIMPGPSAPAGCQLPGSGCGTITWKVKATKKGSAQIRATRTSCGEALKCAPQDAIYMVKIKVI